MAQTDPFSILPQLASNETSGFSVDGSGTIH